MRVYCNNEKAELSGIEPKIGSRLDYIYDSMFELVAEFESSKVTIIGDYGLQPAAVDSFCIGNTNALSYELKTRDGDFKGEVNGRITVVNFDAVLFIKEFELALEGTDDLYLGHLFLGMKTTLPRFETGPEISRNFLSSSSRSFGGQAIGIRRKPLDTFAVNFPRITQEERETILNYADTVLNIEPHIIDPYYEARDKFPPMYVTLDSDVGMTKRNENRFYYSASLSWQEAR